MKNLKLAQDSQRKWNIVDTITNRVVTGHFTNKTFALDAMKNYKEPVESVAKTSNSMSRKDQIRHARAKAQGISYSDYLSKYVFGG
jgi:ribosomal protein S2